VISGADAVTCRGDDGGEFTVQPVNLTQGQDNDGGPTLECHSDAGQTGVVEWKAAQLSGMKIASAELQTRQDLGDVVLITFDQDGANLFADVTQRLVGFPLAIYLGEQLLEAPTVQMAILDGQVTIEVADNDVREQAYAVVVGGELPFPVTSIEFQ
jgi:preprotein translocase subunit SecD